MYVDYTTYLQELIKDTLANYPQHVAKQLLEYDLTGPMGVRQQLGRLDINFFARAYFPEYFEYTTPGFHRDAYKEANIILNKPANGARLVRVWPRGNAKSTIYNFFIPTNAALYGKRHLMVQVSDTEDQAQGFLGDIKNAIENNEHILDDFGDVRGDTWRADRISVRATTGQLVWVAAVGAGSGVRGLRKAQFRPDLIIVDDLENDASVITVERINRLHQWFNRALMNLGNNRTDVIVVGTLLAYDCVLDRLLQSPSWDTKRYSAIVRWSDSPLWEDWKKLYVDLSAGDKVIREAAADEFFENNKEEMLKDTATLWPEYWSYDALMKRYIDIGDVAFFAEQQNEPINREECPFDPEWFKYYDNTTLSYVNITEIYGSVDPSLGRTRLSDYSAIIILGRGNDGFIYVLEAIIERMNPDKLLDTLIAKAKQYKFVRFSIETNQFQDLLRIMLVNRAALENSFMPIVELRHTKDKVMRIQSLIPYVKNGYIRFHKNQHLLISQLTGFPKLRWDDGPDALEQAVRIMIHGPSLEPMMTGVVDSAKYGYEDDDGDTQSVTFYS